VLAVGEDGMQDEPVPPLVTMPAGVPAEIAPACIRSRTIAMISPSNSSRSAHVALKRVLVREHAEGLVRNA